MASTCSLGVLAPTKQEVKEHGGEEMFELLKDTTLGSGQHADPRPTRHIVKTMLRALCSRESMFLAGRLITLDKWVGRRHTRAGGDEARMLMFGRALAVDPKCFEAPAEEEEEKREEPLAEEPLAEEEKAKVKTPKHLKDHKAEHTFLERLHSAAVKKGLEKVTDKVSDELRAEEEEQEPQKKKPAKEKNKKKKKKEEDEVQFADEREPFVAEEKEMRRRVVFLLSLLYDLNKFEPRDGKSGKYHRAYWRDLRSIVHDSVEEMAHGAPPPLSLPPAVLGVHPPAVRGFQTRSCSRWCSRTGGTRTPRRSRTRTTRRGCTGRCPSAAWTPRRCASRSRRTPSCRRSRRRRA